MQLFDFKIQALKYCLPYLRCNSDIITVLKAIGARFNNLQDAVLYLLNSLKISEARGIWLDYIGDEVGTSRDETDYTNYFCVNMPHINVAKRFYFLVSDLNPETPLTLDDATFIQKIFAYIGANVSSCIQNEIIEIIKLITNAEHVFITKSNTCVLKINITGSNIIYTSNTSRYIQQLIGSGIYIEEITING